MVPNAVSILLIEASTCHGIPYCGSAGLVDREQEGRDREAVDDGVGDAHRRGAEVGDRQPGVGVGRAAVGVSVLGRLHRLAGLVGLVGLVGIVVADDRLLGDVGLAAPAAAAGLAERAAADVVAAGLLGGAAAAGAAASAVAAAAAPPPAPPEEGSGVAGGGGAPLPDSDGSRGPAQSGSARSVSPSPSSSRTFEHCGMTSSSSRSSPFGRLISTPLSPTPSRLPPPCALTVPAATAAPRIARAIASRSLLLISPVGWRR